MKYMIPWEHGDLRVATNGRSFEHSDGTPFFWLADTGWLMFSRLNVDEAAYYFDDRASRGFNVLQVMVLHRLPEENVYGRKLETLEDIDWKRGPASADPHDYFCVVDQVISLAEARGIYLALVPVWGSVVQDGHLSESAAGQYGAWLGRRYRERPNLVWLNGGDIRGNLRPEVWNALGSAIKAEDPRHLMTFHPFGRTQSSTWFHSAAWLDFNMFQSGHRRYDQVSLPTDAAVDDNPDGETEWKGEDNWRYVLADRELSPARPTVDGEPSYEGIPQGLHDPTQPRWTASDVRRYAWWSVLAGAAGHTYGNNSVMQMWSPQYKPAYSAEVDWRTALGDDGASQMVHVRRTMESVPHGEGRYVPDAVIEGSGERYDRVLVNSGPGYALAYAFRSRPFTLDISRLAPADSNIRASWLDPASGAVDEIGLHSPGRRREVFAPPAWLKADSVLILRW